MAICKDKNGNVIPCDKIKGEFKASDDLSKGTQMKEIYTPIKSTKKDPAVYDKLKKEIESGFAKQKYGYTGDNLNDYIKAKRTDKLYLNPSKNKQQNETLKMTKKGASLLTNTTLGPQKIEVPSETSTETIDKDPSGSSGSRFTFTTSSSNKYKGNKVTGDGLEICSTDNPMACGLSQSAASRQEKKGTAQAQKEAKKSSIYKTKKDGTQKLKKTFDPQGWLRAQKVKSMNRSNKRYAKRQNRRNKRSLF